MIILVTGTSGYIGSRWATRLRKLGHQVVGYDRADQAVDLDQNIQADLNDIADHLSNIPSVDQVHHLAAAKGDWGISTDDFISDNVEATKSLIGFCEAKGVRDWIFYSTVSVLGPSVDPLDETAPRLGRDPYGKSKAECEAILDEYCVRGNARVITIRPSVVFGPENPWNTNIYRLIDQIDTSRFLMVGNGEEVKATSYIGNLIAATEFLFERLSEFCPEEQSIFHYVDRPAPTTEYLVSRIYAALGKRPLPVRLPLWLASNIAIVADVAAEILRTDLPVTSARIKKFCRATNFGAEKIRSLGFEAPFSLDAALDQTIDWHRAQRVNATSKSRL